MSEEAETRVFRVMIVEDHADFRAIMEVLLSRQPDIELLAKAGSLAEAREQAARFEFDVVVLDLGLPDGSGADLIAELRRSNPEVGVLILSASLDPAGIEAAYGARLKRLRAIKDSYDPTNLFRMNANIEPTRRP